MCVQARRQYNSVERVCEQPLVREATFASPLLCMQGRGRKLLRSELSAGRRR